MNIELRPLAEIRPYERNPRINDEAVDAVAESIRQFGFRQPIVVDAEGVIVCGHTRWKAAQKLGLEQVPVHVARDLTPEQARAYRIADNATADLATWDLELLPIELAELKDAGIDWSLLGFDAAELATLFDPGVKQLRRVAPPTQAATLEYRISGCPPATARTSHLAWFLLPDQDQAHAVFTIRIAVEVADNDEVLSRLR